MPELERDHVEGACNEAQLFNWKHACRRKADHGGQHRVPLGAEDAAWTGDGPVEMRPPLQVREYVGGRS